MLTFFREWLQTFSPKNPYFKETQIKKRVTVTPPKPSEDTPSPSPHDLDAPLFLLPASPITWTSDDHNLIKKAPKVNVLELEQFDEFDGSTGSFFNWFLQEGEDDIGLAEYLLEWWSHATESVLILFHPAHLNLRIQLTYEGNVRVDTLRDSRKWIVMMKCLEENSMMRKTRTMMI